MKDEKNADLMLRTKSFSLRIIRLYSKLPKSTVAQVIGKQILRSATSVGAQYREANRAKSRADFISKIEASLQELDETKYWLALLVESGIVKAELMADLFVEVDELISILVTIVKTIKSKLRTS
jgi:four helix bundle protein